MVIEYMYQPIQEIEEIDTGTIEPSYGSIVEYNGTITWANIGSGPVNGVGETIYRPPTLQEIEEEREYERKMREEEIRLQQEQQRIRMEQQRLKESIKVYVEIDGKFYVMMPDDVRVEEETRYQYVDVNPWINKQVAVPPRPVAVKRVLLAGPIYETSVQRPPGGDPEEMEISREISLKIRRAISFEEVE